MSKGLRRKYTVVIKYRFGRYAVEVTANYSFEAENYDKAGKIVNKYKLYKQTRECIDEVIYRTSDKAMDISINKNPLGVTRANAIKFYNLEKSEMSPENFQLAIAHDENIDKDEDLLFIYDESYIMELPSPLIELINNSEEEDCVYLVDAMNNYAVHLCMIVKVDANEDKIYLADCDDDAQPIRAYSSDSVNVIIYGTKEAAVKQAENLRQKLAKSSKKSCFLGRKK